MTTKDYVPSVAEGLSWIEPVDHKEDLPEDIPDQTAVWVGPNIWEMNELVDSTKPLPDSVEWKGKELRMDDWGSWVRHEGAWYRLAASGTVEVSSMTIEEVLEKSRV